MVDVTHFCGAKKFLGLKLNIPTLLIQNEDRRYKKLVMPNDHSYSSTERVSRTVMLSS